MLILASNSPRRKEILSMLGYDFIVCPSNCDENITVNSPADIVCELSFRKAKAVYCGENDTVIGSDTVVSINGMILGKPKDENDAEKMLKMLSGKSHMFYTGITVINNQKTVTDYVKSEVFFRKMKQKEITDYIKTKEPMDKAGAYGIQGKGAAFIEKINGDFYAVMGLSACYLSKTLSDFGIYPKNTNNFK